MSTHSIPLFIAAALCIASACAPQGARAAEASRVAPLQDHEPVAFTYRFDAADLQSVRGTRQLYRNLVLKAQRACAADASSLALYRMDRHCAATLVNDVVLRIGSPVLAALHAKSAAASGFAAAARDQDVVGSL